MSHLKQMLSGRAAKAYAAGAVAAIAFATPVVDDGLLVSEVLGIVGAFLVGFQAVFWTSNAPAE